MTRALHAVGTPSHNSEPAQLPLVVLSRYLGERRATVPMDTNMLCQLLSLCGRTRLPDPSGTSLPAPFPDLPTGGWPHGASAVRALGLNGRDIGPEFEQRRDDVGVTARLEEDVIAAFFPKVLWPVVHLLAMDGPAVGRARAERTLRKLSRTVVPANKRRPAGRLARSTVAHARDVLRRVFAIFAAVNAEGGLPGISSDWTGVPQIGMPDMATRGYRTSGPRPERLREAWDETLAAAEAGLGVPPGEDLVLAVERLNVPQCLRAPFKLLRDLVLIGIMCLTGGRVRAVADLKRSDYLTERVGPAPDHRRGPALRMRPGKSMHPDEPSFKPIPRQFARYIDAYFLLLEKVRPILYRHHRTDASRPDSPDLPGDFPLLVSNRTTLRAWGQAGIRNRLSGLVPRGAAPSRPKGYRGIVPLIARESGFNPELSDDERRYVGYNPHAYRHSVTHLAKRAAEIYNVENPSNGSTSAFTPEDYASALLDHKEVKGKLIALYSDRHTAESVELLAGRAIEVIWRLLTTDLGARKRVDSERYREALERRREMELMLGEVDRRRAEFDSRPTRSPEALSEGLRIADDRARLYHEIAEVRGLLKDLRLDDAFKERVPDSAPPGAESVDLEAIERAVYGDAEASEPAVGAQVRDWLTVTEFARLLDVNRATVTRLLAGETSLRGLRGATPWKGPEPPVDASLGARFRRIWTPGISDALWPTSLIRRNLRETLSEWPSEQGWTRVSEPLPRCFAPIKLPPAYDPEGGG